MGCDGWIENPKKPITISYTCYGCSETIDPDNPIKGHEGCLDADGKLSISREIDNFERR